jgi:hypothetical protein
MAVQVPGAEPILAKKAGPELKGVAVEGGAQVFELRLAALSLGGGLKVAER